ncbi:cellulose-binding domain-containing protein, partial [Micromonospora sp. KC213]|uniref:cellulose-binding domain-containing protein n=1 Tax=Micromonospora sp. KC213 TaxID=2530378 RepID=UPI0010E89FF3
PSTPPPSSPPPGGTGCAVTYTPNSWGTGFTAEVRITNTGTSTINGWTLAYTLPSGQRVTNAWNATVSQSGQNVIARNAGHNGTIAPQGTASFGHQGTLSGPYSSPTSFTLNGVTCSRS